MSRRKDLERYQRLKDANPDYSGFRGASTSSALPAPQLETVVCSQCHRRRNVPVDTVPEDRDSFVCRSCQDSGEPEDA